jgi:putative nucleotidyltransferase with HDIG domain
MLPKPFTLYSVGLFVIATGTAVALFALGQDPPLGHVLVLGCLFAIAENTGVEFAEESGISASLMFIVASVVLFHDTAPELGPLLVGLFGGLFFEHFRDHDLRKVLFNSANFGLAAFIAACVFNLIVVDDATLAFLLVASIPVVLVESTANWLFVVPGMAMLTKRPIREVGRDVWVTEFQVLPFGFLGVVLGSLYLSLGGWVVPLFIAPIFIARQACASVLSLREARDAALSTLVRALEAKDQYTAGHVERVAKFAVDTGKELGFRHSRLERLRYAALMHDIGKLIIPNQILNKPGKLTASEYERMRHHEHVSVELLRRIEFLAPVVPSIEADQGSFITYPDAPLETRILAVADAFDAMTSTRAYRRALTQEVAFSELRDKSGSQFDGECVEALIRTIEQRGEVYGAGFEETVADFKAPPPVAGTGSAGLGDLAKDGEEVRR